jgi:effector-binding domain-containing protein
MEYQIRIENVQAQPLAVARGYTTIPEIPRKIFELLDQVWPYVKGKQIPNAGINVAIYRPDERPGHADGSLAMEAGAQVLGPFPESEHVIQSATPAGTVATATHIGPYNRLGDAHTALRNWCAQHGHQCTGTTWEVYGHWTDDESKLRTGVFYLLSPHGRNQPVPTAT